MIGGVRCASYSGMAIPGQPGMSAGMMNRQRLFSMGGRCAALALYIAC
jgi:hypothetical protein